MLDSGAASIRVDAPAQRLYEMVSDVTRMGEWSPECRACEWLGGTVEARVGARFRGHNRWGLNRWSRVCEVMVADPGREFAFRTIATKFLTDSTIWRYRFSGDGRGTMVSESYQITAMPPWWVLVLDRLSMPHHFDMRPHLEETLQRLKVTAEETGDP
jgi:hypothetical protein